MKKNSRREIFMNRSCSSHCHTHTAFSKLDSALLWVEPCHFCPFYSISSYYSMLLPMLPSCLFINIWFFLPFSYFFQFFQFFCALFWTYFFWQSVESLTLMTTNSPLQSKNLIYEGELADIGVLFQNSEGLQHFYPIFLVLFINPLNSISIDQIPYL